LFNTIVEKTRVIIEVASNNKKVLGKPKLIVGLSGGPDSVFLFHILKSLAEEGVVNLIAAHLDHGWRDTSSKDVDFCRDLAKSVGVEFFSKHSQELDIKVKNNGSQEEVGRKLRKHFFKCLQEEKKSHFITLAHHQQDQQETFFFRMLRGTSLSGLRCMDSFDGVRYLRPLLFIRKDDILKYLHENNIHYLIDPTNKSDKYLRNRIRKKIIPEFRTCDRRFDKKFEDMLQHVKTEDNFLKKITREAFFKVFSNLDSKDACVTSVSRKAGTGNINVFLDLDEVIQKRFVVEWFVHEQVQFSVSDGFINEILKFLRNGRGGSHQAISGWRIVKKGPLFWVEKKTS
jgi:tRNA(Ile)-lysidine synthase